MPTFKSSRPTLPPDTALASALPELRAAELRLRKNANQHGITYVIAEFGGIRSQADTTQAMTYREADYAVYLRNAKAANHTTVDINTFRPIAPFGNSFHNYGAAFDVFITSVPEGRTQSWGLEIMKVAAQSVGLRSNVPNDPPHFELPVSLSDAKAKWTKYQEAVSQGHAYIINDTAPKGTSNIGAMVALAALAGLLAFAVHRGATK
jgi:hypothetical protein